jgi:hypothetical protein
MPTLSALPTTRKGRPPQVEVSAQDAATLRKLYMQSNRNSADGSKILAARLAAQQGLLGADLSAAILKPRRGNALPSCIADAMHTAPAIIARQRNARDAALNGMYCPGCLRMVEDPETGLRRLQPGERQSWDDATINFGVCIPWPWGGDPCSDRHGVRVGRFQLLTCVDDATDCCLGFDYVIRDRQSYRAEDVIAAQYRLWRNHYQPERVVLEGGAWQAKRSRAFHAAAGVVVEDATGRPNSKLIEGFFNRLWTPLSLMPGNVGRYRGEQKRESDIYVACREGRKDPRRHFPMLDRALEDLQSAIRYVNEKEICSPKYGRWIPREMHDAFMMDRVRPRAEKALWMHAAPVVEERSVRRGMVQVTCPSPYGESFTYHFAEENLWNFEGRQVRVYFDPWGELAATIQLVSAHRGMAAGTVVCQAVCIEDAPQVKRTAEAYRVELDASGRDRAIAMRNAQRHHIRREHRAIAADGKSLAGFASDLRAPAAAATIQSIPQADHDDAALEAMTAPKPARREDWRDNMQQRLAEADQYEAEAIKRGELIPA